MFSNSKTNLHWNTKKWNIIVTFHLKARLPPLSRVRFTLFEVPSGEERPGKKLTPVVFLEQRTMHLFTFMLSFERRKCCLSSTCIYYSNNKEVWPITAIGLDSTILSFFTPSDLVSMRILWRYNYDHAVNQWTEQSINKPLCNIFKSVSVESTWILNGTYLRLLKFFSKSILLCLKKWNNNDSATIFLVQFDFKYSSLHNVVSLNSVLNYFEKEARLRFLDFKKLKILKKRYVRKQLQICQEQFDT